MSPNDRIGFDGHDKPPRATRSLCHSRLASCLWTLASSLKMCLVCDTM